MKKWLTILLIIGLLIGLNTTVFSQTDSPIVKVDGNVILFSDEKPLINTDSRTLVPVRFVVEALNCEVFWNGEKREVTIKNSEKTIVLKTGEKTALVNDKEIEFDTKAELFNGRTFVPLRFISESLGTIVDWDAPKNTILMNTPLNLKTGSNINIGEAENTYKKEKHHHVTGVYATHEEPFIIENYNISSNDTNGLLVENCENIIIRNNYIHDCNWAHENDPYDWHEGLAVRIVNCKNVTLENNLIINNKIGVRLENCEELKVLYNTVKNHKTDAAIKIINCKDYEVAYNHVKDNGLKEYFYDYSVGRSIGIWSTGECSNADIHHNESINNTSDGISVTGQYYENNDWTTVASDIRVFNNYISGNLEQGIWGVRAKNLKIYNNEIHVLMDKVGVGVGIAFEFDVSDSEIYNNRIFSREDCRSAGGFTVSHNNYFHDNILYADHLDTEVFNVNDEGNDAREKASLAGIEYKKSSGNTIKDNHVLLKN